MVDDDDDDPNPPSTNTHGTVLLDVDLRRGSTLPNVSSTPSANRGLFRWCSTSLGSSLFIAFSMSVK